MEMDSETVVLSLIIGAVSTPPVLLIRRLDGVTTLDLWFSLALMAGTMIAALLASMWLFSMFSRVVPRWSEDRLTVGLLTALAVLPAIIANAGSTFPLALPLQVGLIALALGILAAALYSARPAANESVHIVIQAVAGSAQETPGGPEARLGSNTQAPEVKIWVEERRKS